VRIGEFSRGGQTRGGNRALDHDLGCEGKYVPCGIVDEKSGQEGMTFGSASNPVILLSMPLKPSGRRTPFLYRLE
jgi:hypothetical protein